LILRRFLNEVYKIFFPVKSARIEIRGGYSTGTEGSVLTMIADHTHSITCRVFGSSPPGNVGWWRANKKLNSYENITEVFFTLTAITFTLGLHHIEAFG
jgi:hypothetical protein